MWIDLHVHEKSFSKDSLLSLEEIASIARQRGLDGVCILAFIRTIGEYTMSALLYGVHNRPVSISIITNMQEYQVGISLAYGVIVILICSLSLALVFRLDRNRFF